MKRNPGAPLRKVRVALVLEVGHGWEGEQEIVFVIASIAGRPDTMTVTWPVGLNGLSVKVLEDLMLEADQLITLALESFVGVQEVLPLA